MRRMFFASYSMTGQYTSLTLAALKQILAGIEGTLAIIDREGDFLSSSEKRVKDMLQRLRRQVQNQIENHPENRR